MRLVKAGKEKIETYLELWFSLAKGMEEYSDLNKLSYNSIEEVPEQEFVEEFENETSIYYLIKEKDDAMGFVTLERGEHSSREYSKYLRIVNLFVKEKYRDKGYGSKVIGKTKEIARKEGADHIKVSAEWGNSDARRFYKKNGFEEKQVDFVQKLD